jgi:hypothetical protein
LSREEHPREDLLREATGLKQRVEFRLPDDPTCYVAGFRSGGSFSLYCDEEPVFQFNDQGELRRGFWQGCLLKAESRQLIRLRRDRPNSNESYLLSSVLTDSETAAYLEDFSARIDTIQSLIETAQITVIGEVPEGSQVLQQVVQWNGRRSHPVRIAEHPRVNS